MTKAPRSVQRKRTKGWKKPPNTICVGRGGYFGNPFKGPRAANGYRRWLLGTMGRVEFHRRNTIPFAMHFDRQNVLRELPTLRGKNLACWCRPGHSCHADVLLELANAASSTPKATLPEGKETQE